MKKVNVVGAGDWLGSPIYSHGVIQWLYLPEIIILRDVEVTAISDWGTTVTPIFVVYLHTT